MKDAIPSQRRAQVKTRESNRCLRCGGPGAQWHHRRSRRVVDAHRHCSCNGVWLCKTCHDWAHAHPFEARQEGLIVSRHEREPGTVTVVAYFGSILLRCDGMFDLPAEKEEGEA